MSTHRVSLASMTFVLALAACRDPANSVAHATTGAANTAPGPAPAAHTEHLALSSATSHVQFVASKVTRSHDGQFGQFTGSIDFAPEHVESSRIHLDIDTASVSTDTPQLTGHLRSPDFFDVARFPHATFDSTEIR